MSTTERRKTAAPPYAEAVARLQAERPADAQAVTRYVHSINAECRRYRQRLADALAQKGRQA